MRTTKVQISLRMPSHLYVSLSHLVSRAGCGTRLYNRVPDHCLFIYSTLFAYRNLYLKKRKSKQTPLKLEIDSSKQKEWKSPSGICGLKNEDVFMTLLYEYDRIECLFEIAH